MPLNVSLLTRVKHIGLLLCACLFFALSMASNATPSSNVKSIRLWHSPDSTRVVFDVSASVKYKLFNLQNPLRLVVDVQDVSFNTSLLPKLDQANPHIKEFRSGVREGDTTRFVLELKKPLKHTAFVLQPNDVYSHRLVIDFKDPSPQEPPVVEIEVKTDVKASTKPSGSAQAHSEPIKPEKIKPEPVEVKEKVQSRPVVTASSSQRKKKRLLIAIDAGHGGEDPGARGYKGSREKKLTLQMANRLKAVIDADPRFDSYMIRKGDYYVGLHKRRQMAREVDADMFISIHADAFKQKNARGFSVFALSQRGATSAMASALAQKENASDLIGGVSLKDKDRVLAQVLVDLSMTNTISESVNFGGRVLNELKKIGRLHSKRVEQAGFAVLKSPDIPSVLIETGFITNPTEERNLRSSSYQKRIAKAIFKGISDYFKQTPYRNNATYASPAIRGSSGGSSSSTGVVYHKVVRGDSLSEIAKKYGVSQNKIKQLNKMRRSTVMLGQRLKIPANNKLSRSSSSNSRSKTSSSRSGKRIVHTVRRGDSLSKISKKYNVKIGFLKKTNNLRKNNVYLGQRIVIPAGISNSRSVSNKRSTTKKTGYIRHKVKRGDTLSGIGEKYHVSMKEIMKANKLRSRNVMLGQVLKIPQ